MRSKATSLGQWCNKLRGTCNRLVTIFFPLHYIIKREITICWQLIAFCWNLEDTKNKVRLKCNYIPLVSGTEGVQHSEPDRFAKFHAFFLGCRSIVLYYWTLFRSRLLNLSNYNKCLDNLGCTLKKIIL